jgi:hypothetical protein
MRAGSPGPVAHEHVYKCSQNNSLTSIELAALNFFVMQTLEFGRRNEIAGYFDKPKKISYGRLHGPCDIA